MLVYYRRTRHCKRRSINGDKNIIPFVVEYNPSLPNIGLVTNKYWGLLQLSNMASVNCTARDCCLIRHNIQCAL